MPKVAALENAEWMTPEIQEKIQPYLDQGYLYVVKFESQDGPLNYEDSVEVLIGASAVYDPQYLFMTRDPGRTGQILRAALETSSVSQTDANGREIQVKAGDWIFVTDPTVFIAEGGNWPEEKNVFSDLDQFIDSPSPGL